jgi:hypothetical protein
VLLLLRLKMKLLRLLRQRPLSLLPLLLLQLVVVLLRQLLGVANSRCGSLISVHVPVCSSPRDQGRVDHLVQLVGMTQFPNQPQVLHQQDRRNP